MDRRHPKTLESTTRYAGVSRRSATAVLTATLVGIVWCLWITSTQQTGQLTPPADEKKGEVLSCFAALSTEFMPGKAITMPGAAR